MIGGWVRRHRRALLLAAGVAGAGWLAYYVVQTRRKGAKLVEEKAEVHASFLRQEADDRAEVQLQNHFESIQRISDSTTLPSVLPHLKVRLFSLVDLSEHMDKLMLGKEDPQALTAREKLQLWQELKLLSFTRTLSAMWAVSLLDLFVRTQLNILGRHVYTDTARALDASKAGERYLPLSMSCQHRFIAFADYLPHKGLSKLVGDMQAVVELVMKSKALKDAYDIANLNDLFFEIRQNFEAPTRNWMHYVLPVDNMLPDDLAAASIAADAAQTSGEHLNYGDDAARLGQLMMETRRVLSSKEFDRVLSSAVDAVLEGVVHELFANFKDNPSVRIPLAKLLPPVASVGNSLLEHPEENRYTEMLSGLPEVQSFCAMVYSSTGEG